jgi:hypothetical protein
MSSPVSAEDSDQGTEVSREILLHLLEHHGQHVRFEASVQTTEFMILKMFGDADPNVAMRALRILEIGRLVYRRTQYVAGYSEPKHVLALTPTGHRAALACQKGGELRLGEVDKHARSSSSDDDFPDDDYCPAPDYGNDDGPAGDWQSDND